MLGFLTSLDIAKQVDLCVKVGPFFDPLCLAPLLETSTRQSSVRDLTFSELCVDSEEGGQSLDTQSLSL